MVKQFFYPKTIAIVGATADSKKFGNAVTANLLENENLQSVLGYLYNQMFLYSCYFLLHSFSILLFYRSQSSSPNKDPNPIIINIKEIGLRIKALPKASKDQSKKIIIKIDTNSIE